MLTGSLNRELNEDYRAFFRRYGKRLSTVCSSADPSPKVVRRTQRSFGFEWSRFSSMQPHWEKNFWGYLAPYTPEFFRGKTVLDAGCGMGRHLYYVAQHAKEVIGIDNIDAVTKAGCHRVAVISDILLAPEIEEQCRMIKAKLKKETTRGF